MKILMIAPVPFFNDRGCSVRIYEEAMALQRRGHIVKIISYHLGADMPGLDIVRIPNIPWYQKIEAGPSWHRFYLDALVLVKALTTQRRFKASVVHGHLHEGCLIGWVVAHLFGVPLVFDYQGSMTEEIDHYDFISNKGLMHRVFATTEWLINRLPERILVSGGSSSRALAKSGVAPDKISSLLDGVGKPVATSGATGETLRQELSIPEDARVIAYAGSLSAVENIDGMLAAATLVVAREPRAFFLIAGHPNVDEHRAHALSLGIARHVLFLGRIPYLEVPKYLALAELTVSTKLEVEANAKLYTYMQASKPVVAFDHPVNREALGDLGYYPRAATPEAFAETILASLALPLEERHKRGEELLERVTKHFSWDARTLDLEDTYRQLTSRPAIHQSIRHHWPAILIATVVGILCSAPFLYFTQTQEYKGVVMMGSDAEDHYLARMQEVAEGHWSTANTFLPNKDQPYLQPGGGELLAMSPGALMQLSASQTEMLNKFLFPFFAALLLYALGYLITRSRGAGVLCAAAVLLGDGNLLSNTNAWKSLFHGSAINTNFLSWSRPINPEVSGIALIASLLLMYRIFIAHIAHKAEYFILAVVIGCTVYISPFIFTFLALSLVLHFMWLLLRRNKMALLAFAVGVGAIICTIPFLLNYFSLVASSAYADSSMRLGVVASSHPILGLWLPILLCVALFVWPRRYSTARPLFIISAVALFALLNQQLVTGHILQPGHYHWYITMPLVLIMLSLLASYFIENLSSVWLKRLLFAAGIGIFIYNGVITQTGSYKAWLHYSVASQRYAPVLQALNTLPDQSVVWTDPDLSIYIPIYTRHDSPADGQLSNYLIPLSFMQERLLVSYRLRDIPPDQILATMEREREAVSSALFSIYWAYQKGSFGAIPQDVLVETASAYKQSYSTPLADLLKNLGVTAVAWDSSAYPTWHIDRLLSATKITEAGGYSIYRLR